MPRFVSIGATLAVALCIVPGAARAQLPEPAPTRGSVTVVAGRVSDGRDAPIPAARVSVPSLGRATTTDAAGRFRLRGLSGPGVVLHVTQIGYAPRRIAIGAPRARGGDVG